MDTVTRLISSLQKITHSAQSIAPTEEQDIFQMQYARIPPPRLPEYDTTPQGTFQSLPLEIQQKILVKPLRQSLRRRGRDISNVVEALDDIQNYYATHVQQLRDFDAMDEYRRETGHRSQLSELQHRARRRQALVTEIANLEADHNQLIGEHDGLVTLYNEYLDLGREFNLRFDNVP